MSVDYEVCSLCGETFPDCGGIYCECVERWCSKECAKLDGFKREEENADTETTCSYCRDEKFTDSELLTYLLEKNGLTLKELTEEYKEYKTK